MRQQDWSKTTSTIFYGVLIFSLAGIVKAILEPIAGVIDAAASINRGDIGGLLSGGLLGDGGSGSSLSFIVKWLAPIAVIVGYIMYLSGLGSFKKLLGGDDGSAVGKVRTGVILALIGVVVAWIPIIGGFVGGILAIIGFILEVIGFSNLKSSTSFPEDARRGASKLFTALILLIIGWVVGFIPFVGSWFEGILGIIAFILTLLGWAKIKNAQVQV
jgi:uncharacterized membrane protein